MILLVSIAQSFLIAPSKSSQPIFSIPQCVFKITKIGVLNGVEKMKFKSNQITAIFLIFGAILTIVYDIYALFFLGADNTISYVINDWSYSSPLGTWLFGFVSGGLVVHFLKWAPLEKQIKKDE